MKQYLNFKSLSIAALILIAAQVWAAPAPKLAPVLQPYVNGRQIAGAVVLVADKDKILDCEAVGWMDVARKQPMRTDCMFWIASQSKPITATALMMLADEGKVNVEDPVIKYLPAFTNLWLSAEQDGSHQLLKRPQNPFLVRNILSHTSGLVMFSDMERPTYDLYPLEARVYSYAMSPLQFEPGTKYQYSNAGINTAGRIVEVVSGVPFEVFLEVRLFKPLGMNDTTFFPSASQIKRLAKAYKPGNNGLEECPIVQLKYPLSAPEREAMPAGGLFSTAHDLSIFYRMLANGGVWNGQRILSEKAVQQMTSKQTGDLPTAYGFGIKAEEKWFGHGGAYHSDSRYDREHKLITVFLGQHASWPKGAEKCIADFQKAATVAFGKR